jgi:hypothetical protein
MKLDKRLSALEQQAKPTEKFKSYGELLEAESTPGTPENIALKNLYDENRSQKD